MRKLRHPSPPLCSSRLRASLASPGPVLEDRKQGQESSQGRSRESSQRHVESHVKSPANVTPKPSVQPTSRRVKSSPAEQMCQRAHCWWAPLWCESLMGELSCHGGPGPGPCTLYPAPRAARAVRLRSPSAGTYTYSSTFCQSASPLPPVRMRFRRAGCTHVHGHLCARTHA